MKNSLFDLILGERLIIVDLTTKIGGHHHECIPEVNQSSMTVRQAAFIKDLLATITIRRYTCNRRL